MYFDLGICFLRERSGYRHYSTASRDALTVSTPEECSRICGQNYYCKSFSYRYFFSGTSSPGGENCLLSDFEADSLNSASDLIPDSNWDVYRQQCRDGGGGGGGLIPPGAAGKVNSHKTNYE